MANTKKLTNMVVGSDRVIVYLTIAYVDAQETNLVVYDSSVVATALGRTDPLTCHLESVWATTNTAAGLIKLNWDASSPVLALAIPGNNGGATDLKFKYFGGLKNQGGSGITGDITLTTTGLSTGESITVILEVRAN